ncbi:MAG: TetR/AcrR family transcriptional regulator [Clostridiales bacterium]|nr:TetR/AcrR family transcriptional regulator [Clostridiales bacterium]HBM81321.1 TetR/AcrR family transcriptional regulator [Clostridiaceae bacterium]
MPKVTFFNLDVRKQEKVVRSAISEFVKNGFEKGNMESIAKTAGVAKGSMYQYFDNKKELFLYSVQWAAELIVKKYENFLARDSDVNIFDYFYNNINDILFWLKDEREIIIFFEDIYVGKYANLTGESVQSIMNITDGYVIRLIHEGKEKGYIRNDIDDETLCIFLTAASFRFKQYIMNNERKKGKDILDKDMKSTEKGIRTLIELMKNGMAAR